MSRTLHASVVTETTAGAVRLAYLVDLILDSGALYFWTGLGSLSYGGNTYTGTGNLGSVSAIEESAEVRASGIRLQLSGIASSLISIVLGEHLQGRTARVYIAFFDSNWTMVGTPATLFVGRIDQPEIDDTGETCVIELSVENRLIDFERPGEVRTYTDQDQQRYFSGDRGFQFIEALQEAEFFWGQKQPGAHSPPPIGGGNGGYISPDRYVDPGNSATEAGPDDGSAVFYDSSSETEEYQEER